MKIFNSGGSLDNLQCEYAAALGYTHIQHDGVMYKIIESEEFGYDWEAV